MKFVDEVKVFIKSGSGGSGACSFRREKFIEFGGPDGGNGGKGGDIIFCGDRNISSLLSYRFSPHINAKNGNCGSGRGRIGESAKDIICKVPVGTQILDLEENLLFDITEHKQNVCVAKGGRGGRGNATFKSSTNKAPRDFTSGQPGQEITLKLRLKVIADIGLVGLPNAGKSTFISMISNARPKIADYPFSTLRPNLGVVATKERDFVIADIPGIIENAHKGVGLGHRFLKHIERCKALLYLIDATSKDVLSVYQLLKKELSLYKKDLEKKQHIVVLTKCDLLDESTLAQIKSDFKKDITNKILVSGLHIKTNLILNQISYVFIDLFQIKQSRLQNTFNPLN